MRVAVLLLAFAAASLAWAQSDSPPSPVEATPAIGCDPIKGAEADPRDPHAGRNLVMKACTQQWLALDAALDKDLPPLGECGYRFQVRLTEVLKYFEMAMTAKKVYYDAYRKSIEEDRGNTDAFMALQKNRKTEVDSSLAQARDQLRLMEDKKKALIEGAGGDMTKIADAVAQLDKLMVSAGTEVTNLEEAQKNTTESEGIVLEDQRKQANMLERVTLQQRGVSAERLLWVSYYDLRRARIMLGCPDPGAEDFAAPPPGQKKK